MWRLDIAIARHIWSRRKDPELQRLLRGTYVGRWPFSLFAGNFVQGITQLMRHPPYPGRECQPKLFGDFVSNRAVWPSTEVSEFLTQHAATIREEFQSLEDACHEDFNTKSLTSQGSWNKVHLMSHAYQHAALEKCPATQRVLRSIPFCYALGSAYFSIIAPGTTVRPHFGPTNFRVRYHLGLEVAHEDGAWLQVGRDVYRWHEGCVLAFSDAFIHAVRVDDTASRRRVVFIVDVYHPDLTLQERCFLEEIQAIHASFHSPADRGAHGEVPRNC